MWKQGSWKQGSWKQNTWKASPWRGMLVILKMPSKFIKFPKF